MYPKCNLKGRHMPTTCITIYFFDIQIAYLFRVAEHIIYFSSNFLIIHKSVHFCVKLIVFIIILIINDVQ
jgi:hypothetical protein